MDNQNQDRPVSPKQPDNIQGGDSKTNQEQNKLEKEDLKKSDTSAKVDGKNNDAIVIGGNVSNSVVEIHHHYHDERIAHTVAEEKLRTEIVSRKKKRKSTHVTKPKGKKEEQWFESLDEYGKYYIAAVCFFYGLKVSDFRVVLNKIKGNLSADSKKSFSFQHPSINIVEKFDAERLAVTISLSDDNLVDRTLILLQEKYTYLLFNFVPILKEIVETHPENWEIRWRSAIALGRISEIDVSHVFNSVIAHWAKDERAYVRAAVGYYYYYILSAGELFPEASRKYLLDKLERWASPKDFKDDLWRYKWTVAATCEKIGLLENEQAESLANQYIENVAGINHIRIADSVIHAFVEWSIKQKFPQVFKFLVSWAESGSAGNQDEDNPYEIRCIVALIAFSAIVEVNYDLLNEDNKQENIFPADVLKTIWKNRSGDENLWGGMTSIGVRYFDFRMGHYFFDMLENWVKVVPDKEFFIEFVSSWLKEIYFNLRSKTRLENRLKNVWAKNSNRTLKSIAQITQEKIKKSI